MPGMSGTSAPAVTAPAPTGPGAVNISSFAFAPVTVTVPAGATVTWTNLDEEPHTVAADDGSFRSPAMDTGGQFRFTFKAAGSHTYLCSIHPFMRGTVVVTS